MSSALRCPRCGGSATASELAQARRHVFWRRPDGACPACAQQELLIGLLEHGEPGYADSVQRAWPFDARALGPLPTPLRLRADPRFTGRGVTVAIADSGFVPHPDLVSPQNRIRAWVDASVEPVVVRRFGPAERPEWPGSARARPAQWHGTMTSVVAAGNGWSSQGLYAGLASEAELVLIHLTDSTGAITDGSLTRALHWLETHRGEFGVRVASLSVAGDSSPGGVGPVDRAVERLVAGGVIVVAAAGNEGVRRIVPPATAPSALTVGGIDDHGLVTRESNVLWHGNFGESAVGWPKPEVVAPSIWVVAPILPGSDQARLAMELFDRRALGDDSVLAEIRERRFVADGYQHADGTSFAAPITASVAACMLEANPRLTPRLVRELMIRAAHPVPGADPDRQGAGAVDAGRSVGLALLEGHGWHGPLQVTPIRTAAGVVFRLHDHSARAVSVRGSWDGWSTGWTARQEEPAIWTTDALPLTPGDYQYKFLVDDTRWLSDPTNPFRVADGQGGINSRFQWPT